MGPPPPPPPPPPPLLDPSDSLMGRCFAIFFGIMGIHAPVSTSASTLNHFPLYFIFAASSSDTSCSKVLMPPSPSGSSLRQLIFCISPCSSPSGSSLQPCSSHMGLIPDHRLHQGLE